MSVLVERAPYGARDDVTLLRELNILTEHHRESCPPYALIAPPTLKPDTIEDVPFLHVGVFKHLDLKTSAAEIKHGRTLTSSTTSGSHPSRIPLDQRSTALQSQSTTAILHDYIGSDKRPLVILDSARSLVQNREVSARLAAALSMQPLATDVHFLLVDPEDPSSVRWEVLDRILGETDSCLVYGFTYILWLAWGAPCLPLKIRTKLTGKCVHFVHSGGWKKLEALQVSREVFDGALLDNLDPASRVIDFYGLVEQVGVIYPRCDFGYRHVPIWAEVVVRDPHTLEPMIDQPGQIQLLNVLAWGAPYHSVLTEDLGQIIPGSCPCGRSGRKFELIGRIPRAELRGCGNV